MKKYFGQIFTARSAIIIIRWNGWKKMKSKITSPHEFYFWFLPGQNGLFWSKYTVRIIYQRDNSQHWQWWQHRFIAVILAKNIHSWPLKFYFIHFRSVYFLATVLADQIGQCFYLVLFVFKKILQINEIEKTDDNYLHFILFLFLVYFGPNFFFINDKCTFRWHLMNKFSQSQGIIRMMLIVYRHNFFRG